MFEWRNVIVKGIVLLVILAVLSLFAPGALCASDSEQSPGQTPDEISMKGKFGIGAGWPGVGVRYWLTDGFALDGSVGFTVANDENHSVGFGTTGAFVLRKKAHLRLLGLAGVTVDSYHSGGGDYTSDRKVYNIGVGVGVEYSFQELPDLTFGAFATGIGYDYSTSEQKHGADTDTTTGWAVSTQPRVGIEIRYYLN